MNIKKFISNLVLFNVLVLIISFGITKYFDYKISHSIPRFEKQQEIEFTKRIDNLYPNGSVTSEGWARHPIWNYKREYIKSSKLWIKEWEFYITYIEKYDIWFSITISDLGYCSLIALSFTDCKINKYNHAEDLSLFSLGSLNLPSNTIKDYKFVHKGKNLNVTVTKIKEQKTIQIQSNFFELPNGEKGIDINLGIIQSPLTESLNRQTTWAHNRNLFYLNEKINGMVANKGYYKFGKSINEIININNNYTDNIFTSLDWGKGVWAYKSSWFWGVATKYIDGKKIGFNLGYGYTDKSPATENCIYYDDKVHKLDNVVFYAPNNGKDICNKDKPWEVKSDDNRVNLKFWPKINRQKKFNFIIISNEQNQVFGYYEGFLILDNGQKIIIEKMNGFVEMYNNNW